LKSVSILASGAKIAPFYRAPYYERILPTNILGSNLGNEGGNKGNDARSIHAQIQPLWLLQTPSREIPEVLGSYGKSRESLH
jgi:hypothetical protein